MYKVLHTVILVTLAAQALALRSDSNPASEKFLERNKRSQSDGFMSERLYRLHTLAKEFYTIMEEEPNNALLEGTEGELSWVLEQQTKDLLLDMQNANDESRAAWENPTRNNSSSALVRDMEKRLKGLLVTASNLSSGPGRSAVKTFEKGLKTLELLSLEVQKAHEAGDQDSKVKRVVVEGLYGEQFPYNV